MVIIYLVSSSGGWSNGYNLPHLLFVRMEASMVIIYLISSS
jgi:hypothetical protein